VVADQRPSARASRYPEGRRMDLPPPAAAPAEPPKIAPRSFAELLRELDALRRAAVSDVPWIMPSPVPAPKAETWRDRPPLL
jgi:hypothetical protein